MADVPHIGALTARFQPSA